MKFGKYALYLSIVLAASSFNCFSSGLREEKKSSEYNYLATEADNSTYSERLARSINDRTDISFTSFNGSDTIALVTTGEGDEVTIEFITRITKGDFTLVFINSIDELQVIASQSERGVKKIIPGKGLNRIKMAGNEADGTISLIITGNGKVEYLRLGQD